MKIGLPITIISVLILITTFAFSFGTIHALPVDRYWSVLEPQKQSTDANGFIGRSLESLQVSSG
jgi:hypothetical protein